MKRKATFGTVSHATMKTDDLIYAFSAELRRLRGALPKAIQRGVQQWQAGAFCQGLSHHELGDELVTELCDALQDYAPPYAYFGAHPGDGSDYGFWLSENMQEDFDGLQVDDTSKVPADYSGEVLHVNDHGNLTLYVASSGELKEIWSLV